MAPAPTNRALAGRLFADGAELLAALLDSTVDGVYAVDGRGRVLFANSAALAILGYDDEAELLGRNSHATIHYLSSRLVDRSRRASARCWHRGPAARRCASSATGSSGVIGHSCRSPTRRLR